jgi:hypothetical protein
MTVALGSGVANAKPHAAICAPVPHTKNDQAVSDKGVAKTVADLEKYLELSNDTAKMAAECGEVQHAQKPSPNPQTAVTSFGYKPGDAKHDRILTYKISKGFLNSDQEPQTAETYTFDRSYKTGDWKIKTVYEQGPHEKRENFELHDVPPTDYQITQHTLATIVDQVRYLEHSVRVGQIPNNPQPIIPADVEIG